MCYNIIKIRELINRQNREKGLSMRVIKTIKDYVARMVREIYNEPTEEEKGLKENK